MTKLIIFLIRRKLGVKKYEAFQFSNQRSEVDWYYFDTHGLWKVCEPDGNIISSHVSLNWLMNDNCAIHKLSLRGENK